jgi:hypothetical protein
VGMLLYLIKHSCPDIANVVRDLSKCMDSATMAAYKGNAESNKVCIGY